ncbi:hypothetical protein DPEC_G00349950 [Dallia pectoralis]|uniref:Uncharacterized protein n=1 Tax=Dallia pectoralis TaxID=75939 RepID=A0ACC2F1M5_DALPE|nr:hypothetical protein DPEC_G00349950 [Dallia pectoralis]
MAKGSPVPRHPSVSSSQMFPQQWPDPDTERCLPSPRSVVPPSASFIGRGARLFNDAAEREDRLGGKTENVANMALVPPAAVCLIVPSGGVANAFHGQLLELK